MSGCSAKGAAGRRARRRAWPERIVFEAAPNAESFCQAFIPPGVRKRFMKRFEHFPLYHFARSGSTSFQSISGAMRGLSSRGAASRMASSTVEARLRTSLHAGH